MKSYYTGRKKITIPVPKKDFDNSPMRYIKHYISSCVSKNNDNAGESKELKKIYSGVQDIWGKTRINGDVKNNNLLEINHIFRQVEFKKGFMVGNPINYSLAVSDKDTDDLTYLNKYFKDSFKASKDIDKYEDLYICGISEQFIIPKTYDYDIQSEAPFELYNLEIGEGFKVYSDDITKQPLFDVVVSQNVNSKFEKEKVYDVYFVNKEDGFCYNVKFGANWVEKGNTLKKQPFKFLPIVESSLNKNRMGIVELVISIQNALNIIQSNQIDGIVDFVNAYMVFENSGFDTKDKDYEQRTKIFKKTRTISIKSSNPQLPAKVSLLKETMQHSEINEFFELLLQEMYDIVATPRSSGGVTSGGDTGEARILGNGWESAQNQAKVDVTFSVQFEYELLSKILLVCKDAPETPIKDINASDIDIKYSINMSNNILTKTQALQNLYTMHIPYEEALSVVGITSDTHGLGEKWAKFDEEAKTISMKMQSQNLGDDNSTSNDNSSNENEDNKE